MEFHTKKIDEIFSILDTDSSGLTSEEVEKRRKEVQSEYPSGRT